MGLLFLLGLAGLIIWAISADSTKRKKTQRNLDQRNQEWIDFIAGYYRVAPSTKEKALVQRMLADISEQNLGQPTSPIPVHAPKIEVWEVPGQAHAPATGTAVQATGARVPDYVAEDAAYVATSKPLTPEKEKANIQLDNASLLLYFGAFLFVASAGLFVAFGGADGVVRTFVVMLVTAVLYTGGIWLHHNRPRLKQAGQAFAGMGVVLAPLIGATLYTYVFNESQGILVWFLTSAVCLALYTHALFVFRSSLMSYLLIFTFLSLFESGVGIASVPVYYYGWGLAFVAIGLQLFQRYKRGFPELQEASYMSASILLPIAIIVSVAMVPAQGALQLGVSLLLAAAFYGLEVLRTQGNEQEFDAVVTQICVALGVVALTYGVAESWFAAGVSALAVNTAQLLFMSTHKVGSRLWRNYGGTLLVLSLLSVFATIPYHGLLLAATGLLLLNGTVLWVRQQREDAYGLAVLAWMASVFVAGQLTFGPVSALWQTVFAFAGLLAVLAVYLQQSNETRQDPAWSQVAIATYLIAAGSVLVGAVFAQPVVSLVAAVVVAATFLVLARHDKRGDWVDVAGVALFVPLLCTWNTPNIFLLSTLVALALLIALSVRYRRETLRWASTFVWLLVPVALGHADVGGHWNAAVYAWAYVLAMVGLILSRAVARGVVYLSSNVPMASYAHSASLSYVVGYVSAATLAVCISLATPNSQLHTTLVLGVLGLATIALSHYVEKRDDIIALLPVIGQAFLLSAIRPGDDAHALYLFLSLSSLLAIVLYAAFDDLRRQAAGKRDELKNAMTVAVATAFVAPATGIVSNQSHWLMAAGLLAAGLLLLFHVRAGKQSNKELAGGVIILAIWWLMYFAHIHELQAYTHVVVATLGLYAYLRYLRGERQQSDQYLWWMLGVATIPLALQALSTTISPVYSWWLLIEQVLIMLLGMSIQRRFVTRWGLYVALAAVLYQLRDLGYAALAVLALFFIGLAIYKLQKYNDPKD